MRERSWKKRRIERGASTSKSGERQKRKKENSKGVYQGDGQIQNTDLEGGGRTASGRWGGNREKRVDGERIGKGVHILLRGGKKGETIADRPKEKIFEAEG